MEGVTDFPMRLWYHLVSQPDFMSTPFLRITESYPGGRLPQKFFPEIAIEPDTLPYEVTPQVMTANAYHLTYPVSKLLDKVRFVEINCGCPAPKTVGGGAGSSLLRDPNAWEVFLRDVERLLPADRIRIKMRTGYSDHLDFDRLLNGIKPIPFNQLTIHGRTKEQKYTGLARWDLIEQANQSLKVPVVGSGDICSLEDLKEKLTLAPSVNKFIIGRGALRNPWIFEEFRTGKPAEISPQDLILTLKTLGVFYQSWLTHPAKLIEFASTGIMRLTSGSPEFNWQSFYKTCLQELLGEETDTEVDFIPPVLGRVKLLWNYIRSSLPEAFFISPILRSKTIQQFSERYWRICHQENITDKPFSLSHNSQFDWVYTSNKKSPRDAN